ncbi:ABC transporter substrate-binding protein [Paenirhodobacter populi]|uniref:ABC transporter substrate-binding protein n=1 Tax=Paenirhodobacter populi TaxID=2306993 RepID=A0A443JLM5_9RHOB|nr:ABC transporter substrate-binding protein [Sinirhodobacter populi]RWR21420.1 ABC transporter substrate-binding protein [Sinirhodobacter populi]
MKKLLLSTGLAVFAAIGAQAADLPKAIAERGTLQLTVNGTYAPMEYVDVATGKLTGLDIELGTAIADKLGLTVEWSDTAFAQLITSLTTGRSDFIISGLSDRPSRRETMDFVDYLATGAQFLVSADSTAAEMTDLCGKKVGTTRSTSFPDEIKKWSEANCVAAGKPAIDYVPAENSIDARNQLKQGRLDAVVQGSETLPYAMENEPGLYRMLGAPFTVGYQGIAFRKEDTQLREAVTEALSALIADGTYGAILAKYDLSANAVEKPLLNAAP